MLSKDNTKNSAIHRVRRKKVLAKKPHDGINCKVSINYQPKNKWAAYQMTAASKEKTNESHLLVVIVVVDVVVVVARAFNWWQK